jgi:hypothetical protein
MKRFVLIMLAVSLVTAGLISYFASPHPDGLERVAEDKGFLTMVKEPSFSLLSDYTIPGLPAFLSNGIAGIIGVAATFVLAASVGLLFRRRRRDGNADYSPTSRR